MNERIITEIKYAWRAYLFTLSIGRLRAYGRNKGVAKPTTVNKDELINCIIAILSGESDPITPNRKGAPIKDNYVDPKIDEEINRIYHTIVKKYQDEIQEGMNKNSIPFQMPNASEDHVQRELEAFKHKEKSVLRVEDPNAKKHDIHKAYARPIYSGQLQMLDGVAVLLPLNCKKTEIRCIVPIESIRLNDLREGDIITCYAEKGQNALVVTEVLTINGLVKDSLKRGQFEQMDACYPSKRITTYNGTSDLITAKYLQWLVPIGKGQRGCVVSTPKAGKTNFLLDVIKSVSSVNQNITLLALLIDQSPESIVPFRKILTEDNLVYTTYEDEPEWQVFAADFLLNRAKRLAESGKDVLLVVDSLNALARAFNESDASVGGKTLFYGLESKTLHYIKKYFGSARCLEKGGSITIIAALSEATGNPVDDLLSAELLKIGNLEIRLDDTLSLKRIYPAINLLKIKTQDNEGIVKEEEKEVEVLLRDFYLPRFGETGLRQVLQESFDFREFKKNLLSAINK